MSVARALWRLLRVVLHVLGGLPVLALGFPRFDAARRQAHIRRWSAGLLRCLGVTLQVHQRAAVPPACLVVANHVSWLDIACVHAALPQARFVSKADVRRWPLLGWMVAAAGTLFIERASKRDALRVVHHCAEALKRGDTVALFPEGTTGPGPDLLPFHANLLQAAIATQTPVQPVALRYADRRDRVCAAAAYVGQTSLAQSLWMLSGGRGMVVHVAALPARGSAHADRRALADTLRDDIAQALADIDSRHRPA